MSQPRFAVLPTDPAEQRALAEGLFDAGDYLARNADVRAANLDPLTHYLRHGWREGRNPHPKFSTSGYLNAFPALRETDVCPLVHAAWLATRPVDPAIAALFDADHYLAAFPALRAAGVDPLQHYLLQGWKDGADPSPFFSTRHYLEQVPSLRGGEVSPLEHYVASGMPDDIDIAAAPLVDRANRASHGFWNAEIQALLKSAGYDLGPFAAVSGGPDADVIVAMFSPADYRRRHAQGSGQSDLALLTRYLMFDLPRGVPPGPLFDTEHYLRQLKAAGLAPPNGPAFLDWLKRGHAAGLSPTPAFDRAAYAALNPGLVEAGAAHFGHWVVNGLNEQRPALAGITLGASPRAVAAGPHRPLARVFAEDFAGPAHRELAGMRNFREGRFDALVAKARDIEPLVGIVGERMASFLPPWHDTAFLLFKACVERLPAGQYDTVVAMPFCKMGGADFVAGVLTRALDRRGARVLVLRTEQADWERPDWFPQGIATADLSDLLGQVDMRTRASVLYAVLHHAGARRLFNVNSRAAYETMLRFGAQLSRFMALYTYYFCADRRPDGTEVGYAIDFFASLQGNLDCALIDNADFARVLVDRHALTPGMAARVQPLYSPAMEPPAGVPVVDAQIATSAGRSRPRILWAGRFDRQKRFDLVQQIARLLPGWDFLCWGKAVLDQAPDLSALPDNMTLMGTYGRLDELPLTDCDGWLYTSGWDGLPTILIEIAAKGMPVVASAVGGVPELVDDTTGWPVEPGAGAEAYAAALTEMLADPARRRERATALMARARDRHSFDHYCEVLDRVLAAEETAR
ncbi:glycosyltransferase [Paracoccus luteus]|uniref:glycosyltransferase n=1 Tax=Paracoccus luteus TaxID=2508543 RepID=UPI0014316639|nr:glycosyltransferase [Paracoccus luteus]